MYSHPSNQKCVSKLFMKSLLHTHFIQMYKIEEQQLSTPWECTSIELFQFLIYTVIYHIYIYM